MKKITYALALAVPLAFTSLTHADDFEEQLKPHLAKIYDDLTAHAKHTERTCQSLASALQSDAKRPEVEEKFTALLKNWKTEQGIYVPSEYNDDAIDLPHYIDVYHRSNEDLKKQMARVLQSDDAPKIALFKHSFKSINALEYVLYHHKDGALTTREREISTAITHSLCKRLHAISGYYEQHKTDFLNKPKKAVAVILNEFIDSSYKLKEWRLGDAAGLSQKRWGKPNAKHAEYGLSELSVPAMRAILVPHLQLTKKGSEFAQVIELLAEEDDSEEARESFAEARANAVAIQAMLDDISDSDMTNAEKLKPIYAEMNRLHDSYFVGLIDSLSDIVARILDSDGD